MNYRTKAIEELDGWDASFWDIVDACFLKVLKGETDVTEQQFIAELIQEIINNSCRVSYTTGTYEVSNSGIVAAGSKMYNKVMNGSGNYAPNANTPLGWYVPMPTQTDEITFYSETPKGLSLDEGFRVKLIETLVKYTDRFQSKQELADKIIETLKESK